MTWLKRLIIVFVLLDNFLLNFPKKILFKSRWVLAGKCKQCGKCCEEIYLKMTPNQISSKFFTNLAIRWISWLFDFILIRVEQDAGYLVFTCKHRLRDGRCGNYFWRPNICRNYPLVDYFEEPKMLPDCGFTAKLRH
ncbi:MAG: YkgJ family cysteine cluster protein [Candidatus Margulisbacteria bacterium]|nr:YkgJ family cysteine cluster protein [Candidatus Margulisiibacteriota bacterium]